MEIVNKYDELIEKAPIISIDDKVVHMSDFVNDIMYNKDPRLNKERALEDIEVVIDFINQALETEKIHQKLLNLLTTIR